MLMVVLRSVLLWSIAVGAGTAVAQPARLPFDVQLSLVTPPELRVAAGHGASVDIVVTNAGSTAAEPFRVGPGSLRVGEGSLEPRPDSECAVFSQQFDGPTYATRTHELEVPALAAGQSATCRLQFMRPPGAIHDSMLHWSVVDSGVDVAGNEIRVHAGRLSNLDLDIAYGATQRHPDGRLLATHVLTTYNRSDTPLASAALAFCVGDPALFPQPAAIEGCAHAVRSTELDACGFFELGPIGARRGATCRLAVESRATAPVIEHPVSVWTANLASDGGEILDVGDGRKTGVLRVSEAALETIHEDGFEVPCSLADIDRDRLTDCEELTRGTDALSEDTDGDGLLDGDEVLGTVGGLDLPAMGVDPRRKDLLVEMDWTDDAEDCPQHSHRPTTEVLERVRDFYAAAPVGNPDGSTGIHFIADIGQGGPFTGGNYIAIPGGITSNLGEPYRAYKAANFATNRHGYFRYQLHGHRTSTDSTAVYDGVAALAGDDSIVAMRCDRRLSYSVLVLVHELGHNLGLAHGGADDLNGKPNYNSVMNIKFADGLDVDCDTLADQTAEHLAYSDGSRNTLDPEAVDEALGVCATDHPQHQPLDWNCNGVIDPGTVVNPLLRGFGSVVSDHDDYAALQLPPFAPQDRGESSIDKGADLPDAPARISGPCFPARAKSSPQGAGPVCPYPSPFR